MHIFVFRLRFKEHRGRSETVVERVVPDTIIIISSSSACARALDPSLIAIGDRSVGPRWPSPTRQTGRPRYAHCLNRITCITERITSARDRTTRAVCRVRVVRTQWPVERRAGSRRASKRVTFDGVYGFRLLGGKRDKYPSACRDDALNYVTLRLYPTTSRFTSHDDGDDNKKD
ncbi:hypothetical protein QTP88_020013 [Uroleucon formosanum]